MKINHNIPALEAFNMLSKNQSAINKSLQRLSSGKRINSAADDAAGMAISQKMNSQIRGLSMASRNASDGISVIQTAEGALNEVQSILQRMRELSVQASNGTLQNSDRSAIQDEITQLKTEINRIGDTTQFNTVKLLNGDIDMRSSSSDSSIASLKYVSDVVEPGNYKISVTQQAQQEVLKGGTIPSATAPTAGTIYINNERLDIASTDSYSDAFAKMRDLCDKVGINLYSTENPPVAGTSTITMINKAYGTTNPIKVTGDVNTLTSLGLNSSAVSSVPGQDIKIDGSTLGVANGFPAGTTVSTSGNQITITNSGDFEIRLSGSTNELYTDEATAQAASTPAHIGDPISTATWSTKSVNIEVLATGPMNLQIGANEGETLAVRVGDIRTTAMGIDDLNVYTSTNAEKAISTIDDAINYVSRFRGKLGAYQNRLEHTTANLDTANENMTAAMSRIEDTDMAQEMSEYTKENILIQAGNSMLANANQLPQSILKLLQS